MRLLRGLGIIIFWLSWPIIHVSVRLQPRTRILVVCNDRVLVVKDLIGSGRWALPGGGLHKHEPAHVGAARELQEETGITVAPEALQHQGTFHAVNDEHHAYQYDFFVVELPSEPSLRLRRLELVDAQWMTPDEIRADEQVGLMVRERALAWFD